MRTRSFSPVTRAGALAVTFVLSAAAVRAQEPHVPAAGTTAGATTAASPARAAEQVPNAVTGAEIQHGTATPAQHGPATGDATAGGHGAAEACGHHGDDFILPHITDSRCIDLPYWKVPFTKAVALPQWAPIHVGKYAIDLSPTKHVVMLFVSALLCCVILITAAQAHKRHTHAVGRPRGFAAGIEAMVLFIRNEVAIPNLGHHGEKFAPFILTLFFFILFTNLLGLIPYGATATGNISVTGMLAIITFLVIEVAGIRANGIGYLNTIFYWNKDLPIYMRIPMFLIMSPVEMVGKITKPFALAIRLFANMTAGHIVVLALVGLIFSFHNFLSGAPLLMAVAIMMLELFVAFLQAFIFSLLASVFIGQIREAHH
jgi:F-type H+-transporting ATPase subunit a